MWDSFSICMFTALGLAIMINKSNDSPLLLLQPFNRLRPQNPPSTIPRPRPSPPCPVHLHHPYQMHQRRVISSRRHLRCRLRRQRRAYGLLMTVVRNHWHPLRLPIVLVSVYMCMFICRLSLNVQTIPASDNCGTPAWCVYIDTEWWCALGYDVLYTSPHT